MKKFFRLLSLALPYWLTWSLGVICMLIFTICNTVSIMGMIPLIDRVLSNKPIKLELSIPIPYIKNFLNSLIVKLNSIEPLILLKYICIFLIITTFFKCITQFIQPVIMELVSQNVSRDLRFRLFNKFFLLPSKFYTGSRSGELVTRITMDVNLIQVIFSGRFTNTILDTLHFFPFLAIVLLINWKMTVACTIAIPLAMLPIIIIGRQIRKITHKTQQNLEDISSYVFEVIGGINVIKVFTQNQNVINRFRDICNVTIRRRLKSQKKEAILSPLTELIGVSTAVFLLWWFAPTVLDGEMSMGTFITYLTCIACLVKPIKTFGKIQIMMQNALAGTDRIFSILDTPNSEAEVTGKEKNDFNLKNEIRFDNVSYCYEDGSNVLDKLSFTILKGEVVALVGPSGSGKSTIANMVARFFDPVEGRILFDNEDLRNTNVKSLRSIIGMVTQDPVLFNTTIRENIAFARQDADILEIEEAARMARAHEFIQAMDNSYDTIVGERGYRLSGGEKQRISIARALLRNPEIFIFDEATSALDNQNEHLVQEAIDKAMENRTVLVIAHRLSTIRKAHKILVLDKGKIVESGNHESLIEQNGLYKKLYEMNFDA